MRRNQGFGHQAEEIHVATIDSGVCTFLTQFVGDNDINRIFQLCLIHDALK